MKESSVNGTFVVTGTLVHPVQNQPCPVCSRFFCRDGVMELYQDREGGKWYCCRSQACDFVVPAVWFEKEGTPELETLVADRIVFLEAHRGELTSGETITTSPVTSVNS